MTGSARVPTLLVAVNPFKGSLGAREVAAACARGARAAGWSVDLMPGADGGDGLLEALDAGGRIVRTTTHHVSGPSGETIPVEVGWLGADEAIVESRFVVGLNLVPVARRDPGAVSTRGLGELISALEGAGAARVLVGLGGSATMDGGVGMASAWGWTFTGDDGGPLDALGSNLGRLARIQAGTPPAVDLTGLVDVEHVLLGAGGASRFAAQKGASPEWTEALERGLSRLVAVLGPVGAAGAAEPGAGAAGGLGFGLRVFGGGRLRRGAAWMLDRLGFDERLRRADAVVTAEGGFDDTSVGGKLTGTVIRRALAAGVPVGLLAPTARGVPAGVEVEMGGGRWDAGILAGRAAALLGRLRRLPPP